MVGTARCTVRGRRSAASLPKAFARSQAFGLRAYRLSFSYLFSSQRIFRRGRRVGPEMEWGDDGAAAAGSGEGVGCQFIGVETIAVHALIVRLAHNSATIFHHQPIVCPRVFIRWQRQLIV